MFIFMGVSSTHLAPLHVHSRTIRRGSLGSDLDGRSREGKFVRRVELELVDQIGAPTFTQVLAIRRIARLMLQAELFDQKMAGGDWTGHDARSAGAVNNAVLRALKDLGLGGRAEKPALTLADIAARHAKGASG